MRERRHSLMYSTPCTEETQHMYYCENAIHVQLVFVL